MVLYLFYNYYSRRTEIILTLWQRKKLTKYFYCSRIVFLIIFSITDQIKSNVSCMYPQLKMMSWSNWIELIVLKQFQGIDTTIIFMSVKVFRTFYIPDIFASYPSFLLLPTFILLSNLSFLYFSDKFSVRTKWHVWYYTTCLPAHRVSTLLSSRHPKTNKKTETGLFCYIKWMFF